MSRADVDPVAAPVVLGAALTAVRTDTHPPTATQRAVVDALARRAGVDPDVLEAVDPSVAADLAPLQLQRLAHLVVVLELIAHPLPTEVERHAERFLAAAGVQAPLVDVCRATAEHHLVALHADLIRQSWTTEETVRQILGGHLVELARSKLSYYGVGADRAIARRWEALADCPEGSWGRGVADFYRVHGFPFPGQPHGIYEVGALHDWVHVLADYDTSPEGEIDVFGFIAASMADPRGFTNFAFTLALFQNGSVATVGGKHVAIARADTLDDDGAPDRLADAFARAAACEVDVLGGIDVWAHADRPLDELRRGWAIPPKAVPGPGAFDLPG